MDESGSLDQLLNLETGVLPVESLGLDFSLLEEELNSQNLTIDVMDSYLSSDEEILEDRTEIFDYDFYTEEPIEGRGTQEEEEEEEEPEFSFWDQIEGSLEGSG